MLPNWPGPILTMSAKKREQIVKGLERRGNTFRWRKMIDGRRHRFVLQATDEESAVIEVMNLRLNPMLFELGTWDHEASGYITAGLASKELSPRNADNRRLALDLAKRKMGVESPRSVSPFMAMEWLQGEITAHPGSTTPITYLRHLKAFFRYLHARRKIPFDPFAEIKGPPIQKRLRSVFVSTPDVIRLFDQARLRGDRDLEFILALGFECGMRRSEISSCRADWFDLKVGCVTIPAVGDERFARKGREGRRKPATIPLSEPFLEIIGRHGLPDPFVVAPEKKWGKSRYRFDFQKRLKNFLTEHGFGHITIHDLRRSFGSNRVSAGVSIEKVANWMGIDPATAWEHYARFIPADADINRGAAIKPPPPLESQPAPASTTPAERLKSLRELHEAGLISADEAAAKRKEILGTL